MQLGSNDFNFVIKAIVSGSKLCSKVWFFLSLRSLGGNWYASFVYRHRPPQNPSQGPPQQQRFDGELRLRCVQDWTFARRWHQQVCYVSHDGVSSGWHGHWFHTCNPMFPHKPQLKIEFRYNADEPYWHTFGYAEGYAPLEGGKRLHLSYWYGTKFEGWPREEQDFHEIWDRVKKIEMAWQRSRIAQKVEKSIPTKLINIIWVRTILQHQHGIRTPKREAHWRLSIRLHFGFAACVLRKIAWDLAT